ncbi:lojap-related protein [Artemisia annua]|uniref:Lojap-related protein n=1 Tax=Artemisia annua TaxID=35608 RepID=A0A2U1P3W3_ARTAN|nr:lojap-related protein [Artemisia annua]
MARRQSGSTLARGVVFVVMGRAKQDYFMWSNHIAIATSTRPHALFLSFDMKKKVKQKQTGAKRMLLPSVEGQEGGNWIVIDSGSLIVHAFDEKARAYYNLEQLWTSKESSKEQNQTQTQSQELNQAFVKVRRKNNSKKPAKASA